MKQTNEPLVTVLMPVYNAGKYVADSLGSILNQTYRNLEVLVFNDGSTDNSADVIRSFDDPRLQLIDSPVNRGYVAHLNHGLTIAQGKYIARMDADDIALPERLAKQVELLESNPQIGFCGTWFNIVGRPDIVERTPVSDLAIRLGLLANSALAHPTVMMRGDLLRSTGIHYDPHFMPAEDYYMWCKLSQHSQGANIPEVLLNYRHHEGQISSSKSNRQRDRADEIRALQLRTHGFELTEAELQTYYKFVDNYLRPLEPADYAPMKPLMDKLYEQNQRLKAFDEKVFGDWLRQTWLTAVYNIKQYRPQLIGGVLLGNTRHLDTSLGLAKGARVFAKSLISWRMRM